MRNFYRCNGNIENKCPKHKGILVETNFIRFLIAMFLIVNSMSQLMAQPVYTKDNKYFLDRKEMIEACIDGATSEKIDLDGIEIDMEDYCSCFCDKIIPNNTMSEIEAALEKGDMSSLFLREDNLELLIDCAGNSLKISNDFQYEKSDFAEVMELSVKRCVGELLNDPEMAEIFTQQLAYDYCYCTFNKLMSNGFSYEDIQQIDDENSEAFNEITLPCLTDVLNKSGYSFSSNEYNSSDIMGYPSVSRIKLVDYLSAGYKIEISIDGITKYYLFDTGASDLIIDRDMERELLLNGSLKRENYLETEYYTMANNEIIEAQLVNLNGVKVGDYTLNNVVAAIIDDGSLLCGIGFLDKFKKWEINKEEGILILYK